MIAAPTKSKSHGLTDTGSLSTVVAPAKINLFLHIVGRRSDNRHELESIFTFADVGDRLCFERSDEFSLTLSGPFSVELAEMGAAGKNNLVMKAAKMLAARLGRAAFPVALELEKNLPVAAGIGGGSADAAATLRGLSGLWAPGLPANQLYDLALQIGADVPACLAGATARVMGVGEIIEPSPASKERFHAVLVNPLVHLSTAAVFKRYRETSCAFSDRIDYWPDSNPRNHPDNGPGNLGADILSALAYCRNDLGEAAITEAPDIADVLDALENEQGCCLARMSGSGATCFGLFDSHKAAKRTERSLSASRPEWWVTAATLGPKQQSGNLE